MTTRAELAERKAWDMAQALDRLGKYLDGDRAIVYANIRHISASGLTKSYSFHVVSGGELVNITYLIAKALDERLDTYCGHYVIKLSGGNMDLAEHAVYHLSAKLFGEDYAVKCETI